MEETKLKRATFLIMCPHCWMQFSGTYLNIVSEEETDDVCIICPECGYEEWL